MCVRACLFLCGYFSVCLFVCVCLSCEYLQCLCVCLVWEFFCVCVCVCVCLCMCVCVRTYVWTQALLFIKSKRGAGDMSEVCPVAVMATP